MEIKTLEDWITNMIKACPNKLISIQTHLNISLLLNNKENKNFIVFDNAGGMLFTILELASEEDLNNLKKGLKNYLIYGWVINGKSTLNPHQIEQPHWELQRYFDLKK